MWVSYRARTVFGVTGPIVAGIVLFAATCAFAATPTGPSDEAVALVCEDYLRSRADSLVQLRQANRSGVDISQRGTAIALAFDAGQMSSARRLGSGWGDYALDTDIQSLAIVGDAARVTVVVDTDYHYSTSPSINSGIYNVRYRFNLRRSAASWRIVSIDSDDDAYLRYKEAVESGVREGLSLESSIATVEEKRRESDQHLLEINKLGTTVRDAAYDPMAGGLASTYDYNVIRGRNYAERFAPSTAPRWFYYVSGGDCTNFVSQCVWAGFGGYVEGNDTKSKSNIGGKIRMVSGTWQGGTGGGVSKWENVDSLWSYAVSSKTLGPKATGFNNNKK